jgi:cell shape-determining protein MreC
MSGQGYDELIILNRKLDDLLNGYNTLKNELAELKNGNAALKEKLQEDNGIGAGN